MLAGTQLFQCYCNDSFGMVADIKMKEKCFPAQPVQEPRLWQSFLTVQWLQMRIDF